MLVSDSRISEQQYKKRFKQWHFDRKHKKHRKSQTEKIPPSRPPAPIADEPSNAQTEHASRHALVSTAWNPGNALLHVANATTRDPRIFEVPEASDQNNIIFPNFGTGLGYQLYTYAPDADYSISDIFRTADTDRIVEEIFRAPDDDAGDDERIQAADAELVVAASCVHKIPAVDDSNGQMTLLRDRNSLALTQAVGALVHQSATPRTLIPEGIFFFAQQHVETSLHHGFWTFDGSGSCMSIACSEENKELPETHFDLIRSAVLLFQQGSTHEGGRVVTKAFALVKPILESRNVRALNFFWTSLMFLIQFGYPEIAAKLISYISTMAEICLPCDHSIVRMFKLLTQVDMLELEDILHNSWKIITDTLQKRLPKLHPEYVRHHCDLIFRVYGTRDATTANKSLRQLLKECQETTDVPILSHMTILNALGYNAMNSRDWKIAADIGGELEFRAGKAQDMDLLIYQIGGMEIQARAFNELGQVKSAVACLARATPLIAEKWGNDDPWRIELMILQQKWLRENGDVRAADELKEEISRLAEKIDTE